MKLSKFMVFMDINGFLFPFFPSHWPGRPVRHKSGAPLSTKSTLSTAVAIAGIILYVSVTSVISELTKVSCCTGGYLNYLNPYVMTCLEVIYA